MTIRCFFIINFVLYFSSFDVGKICNLVAGRYKEYPNDFVILVVYFADNNSRLVTCKTTINILLDVLKIGFDHIN